MSHWYHCNISNSLRFPLTVVFPRAAASVTVFISVSLSLVKTSPCPTLFRSVLWEYNFLKSLLCQLINITNTLQFSTKSNKKMDLEKIVIGLKNHLSFNVCTYRIFTNNLLNMMPIFWTVRQYIFMVTDRHHLTGLNHKISSLPGQAELYPSQLAGSLTPVLTLLSCLPFPGLWLVSSQPMGGWQKVTWPGPRPPLAKDSPAL